MAFDATEDEHLTLRIIHLLLRETPPYSRIFLQTVGGAVEYIGDHGYGYIDTGYLASPEMVTNLQFLRYIHENKGNPLRLTALGEVVGAAARAEARLERLISDYKQNNTELAAELQSAHRNPCSEEEARTHGSKTLRHLREQARMSPAELAAAASAGPRHFRGADIDTIERCSRMPSFDELQIIEHALCLTAAELIIAFGYRIDIGYDANDAIHYATAPQSAEPRELYRRTLPLAKSTT